jgi:hypothetical protein
MDTFDAVNSPVIPGEAVEVAVAALKTPEPPFAAAGTLTWEQIARITLEAAAPHLVAQRAIDAVLGLHREMPCLDEEGDPIGGSYCEECKDLDGHSGERVHEVYPCMTVREITKALAGEQSFASMRDRIEAIG